MVATSVIRRILVPSLLGGWQCACTAAVLSANLGIHTETRIDIVLPDQVQPTNQFDVQVTLENSRPNGSGERGRLTVSRTSGSKTTVIVREAITLKSGKNRFSFRDRLSEAGFHVVRASFVLLDDEGNEAGEQFSAASSIDSEGEPKVLLIESTADPGDYSFLAKQLRDGGLNVVACPSYNAPRNIAEMQDFNTIVIANVPREEFVDDQLKALAINTEYLGHGLVMLGGESAFGAGGWIGTAVESALPVECDIISEDDPPGVFIIIIASSTFDQGEFILADLALGVESLRDNDRFGMISFSRKSDRPEWLGGNGILRVGEARAQLPKLLGDVDLSDVSDLPALLESTITALDDLNDVAMRRVLVLGDAASDSIPEPLVDSLTKLRLSASTIVAPSGSIGNAHLKALAAHTVGRYYEVYDTGKRDALRRILRYESRRILRSLYHDAPTGFVPSVQMHHPALGELAGEFPPLKGLVRTKARTDQGVDLIGSSGKFPLLATRRIGKGRTVAFTGNIGDTSRSIEWTNWKDFQPLFTKLLTWSMGEPLTVANYVLSVRVQGPVMSLTMKPIREGAESRPPKELVAMIVFPDLMTRDVALEANGPNGYSGSFTAPFDGSYLISVTVPNQRALRQLVTVPPLAALED